MTLIYIVVALVVLSTTSYLIRRRTWKRDAVNSANYNMRIEESVLVVTEYGETNRYSTKAQVRVLTREEVKAVIAQTPDKEKTKTQTLYNALGHNLEAIHLIYRAIQLSLKILTRISLIRSQLNSKEAPIHHPPKFAEYLLYFLPKSDREPLLGDLEEVYHAIYHRYGNRHAWIWYHVQVIAAFWPLLRRAFGKIIKLGIVGWVGNWVRRLIS